MTKNDDLFSDLLQDEQRRLVMVRGFDEPDGVFGPRTVSRAISGLELLYKKRLQIKPLILACLEEEPLD